MKLGVDGQAAAGGDAIAAGGASCWPEDTQAANGQVHGCRTHIDAASAEGERLAAADTETHITDRVGDPNASKGRARYIG